MKKLLGMVGFMFFYFCDVVKSNFRVAYDVITPRHRMKPGIIAVDVAGMTDRQLLFMANLVTMTPGTLCLAISEDRSKLYIHCMYIDGSPDESVSGIEQNYGRRVRDVF